jgi:hypothetical protein
MANKNTRKEEPAEERPQPLRDSFRHCCWHIADIGLATVSAITNGSIDDLVLEGFRFPSFLRGEIQKMGSAEVLK